VALAASAGDGLKMGLASHRGRPCATKELVWSRPLSRHYLYQILERPAKPPVVYVTLGQSGPAGQRAIDQARCAPPRGTLVTGTFTWIRRGLLIPPGPRLTTRNLRAFPSLQAWKAGPGMTVTFVTGANQGLGRGAAEPGDPPPVATGKRRARGRWRRCEHRHGTEARRLLTGAQDQEAPSMTHRHR
jgi:hypothetical protein